MQKYRYKDYSFSSPSFFFLTIDFLPMELNLFSYCLHKFTASVCIPLKFKRVKDKLNVFNNSCT